jgi:hypothetical protein
MKPVILPVPSNGGVKKSSAVRCAFRASGPGDKGKGVVMKLSRLSAAFLALYFLSAAGAVAGEPNKKSLHIYEKVSIDGKELEPGDYKIEWDGSGSPVQLTILKGKQTVATVPATVVSAASSNVKDGYSVKSASGAIPALTQVFFAGQKFNLAIQVAATPAQSANPSGSN